MKHPSTHRPDLLLEASWEVCNKQGGIYTVLTSRAREMMKRHNGQIIFIGPLLVQNGDLPADFDENIPPILEDWQRDVAPTLPFACCCGNWRVPGSPPVVLVDFAPLYDEKGALYYEMWEYFGIQSDKGYGDYDEASLFGIAAAQMMQSLYEYLCPEGQSAIGIFNEWMLGMGLLYAKRHCPHLKTLFLTHATTVGRSIASNNKALYAYMTGYNGDQMAAELGVEAKHGIEKAAAWQADCFATVSELTARECRQLIERDPVVLPNGFEPDFVPQGDTYTAQRTAARNRIFSVVEGLTGSPLPPDTLLIATSGRYEYRNKGIDLFIDAMQQAGESEELKGRTVVCLLLVPAWVAEPRADLRYLLLHPEGTEYHDKPLSYPYLTHWLHNMEEDTIVQRLKTIGTSEGLRFVFVPCYLDREDGLFDRSYYDLLIGMDLTVFPSYYEPWGYTPLESIAFGVPTVTTNLSGFGIWAMQERGSGDNLDTGIAVIERTDFNYPEAVSAIARLVGTLATTSDKQASRSAAAMHAASYAEWRLFYDKYEEAYALLLESGGQER